MLTAEQAYSDCRDWTPNYQFFDDFAIVFALKAFHDDLARWLERCCELREEWLWNNMKFELPEAYLMAFGFSSRFTRKLDRLLSDAKEIARQIRIVNTEKGVSLRDVGTSLGFDGEELKSFVGRFSKSRKITCKPIGKDPEDARAKLYKPAEIVRCLGEFSKISCAQEMKEITSYLASAAREPLPAND